jgi:predicted phage terminase large subunit-like protein
MAPRHRRLWKWFQSLQKGKLLPAQIEVWPRGGAKSSTAELGCAYLNHKKNWRHFVLYVCGTQEQAELHIQAIASLFDTLKVKRAVDQYNNSKGWRQDLLRTTTNFNVAAYGLDVASRGVKLDQYRPDVIIFDDIDSESDSPQTVDKKIRAITSKILPTGSSDCAVLFIQNLIHENSIVSQLVDGRADFLLDRVVPALEPAVRGLKTEEYKSEGGSNRIRIAEGVPTWEGQDLAICEFQINKWGLSAFKREAQHEVKGVSGYFFNDSKLEAVIEPVPFTRIVRAWDLAATQGGGDYTVGVLTGLAENGVLYVLDVLRGQLETSAVRGLMHDAADLDNKLWGTVTTVYPQDPGQAGKDQADSINRMLDGFNRINRPVTGRKDTRAENWQERVNSGNARLYQCSEYKQFKKAREMCQEWFLPFREEHRLFRADGKHVYDDQVDAASDAANELLGQTKYDSDLKLIKGLAEQSTNKT